MVKIEDITKIKEEKKLKREKIEQLAKESFGKSISVSECVGDVYISKNTFMQYLFFQSPKILLVISPLNNEVKLYNEKYFDKAKEFAERFETNFGREVTLQTDYSPKK